MPSTRPIDVFPPAPNLFRAAAEEFIRAARAAIGAQGRFTAALSGGSTPKALYSLLAEYYANFAWNRVFYFSGMNGTFLRPTPKAIIGWSMRRCSQRLRSPTKTFFAF